MRAPQADLGVVLDCTGRDAISSLSLPLEKSISELHPYPNLRLLAARENNIFLLGRGKLPISICPFPRVLAPRRGPCCRWISPGSDLLSPAPCLFCVPRAHQGGSRNERTEALSAALGLRSGDPIF